MANHLIKYISILSISLSLKISINEAHVQSNNHKVESYLTQFLKIISS